MPSTGVTTTNLSATMSLLGTQGIIGIVGLIVQSTLVICKPSPDTSIVICGRRVEDCVRGEKEQKMNDDGFKSSDRCDQTECPPRRPFSRRRLSSCQSHAATEESEW